MNQRLANPWIPDGDDDPVAVDVPPPPALVATTGATAPQDWVTPPEAADQLATFPTSDQPPLWVVGTHGGAGESAVARLMGAREAAHRWPVAPAPAPVLLVARTNAHGLNTAQAAMRSWAARQVPAVRLLGLMLIADAPGRLPRTLSEYIAVIGGGVPHLWRLPWIEDLRLGATEPQLTRGITKTLAEINTVLSTTA